MDKTETVYIGEIETIFVDSGELHIFDGNKEVVIDIYNMYRDLPIIAKLICFNMKEQIKDINKELKQSIK